MAPNNQASNLIAIRKREATLFRRRLRLALSRVAQDENTPLFVGDVDIAARVHQHVLGLAHELVVGKWSVAFDRCRRHEPPDFFRRPLILDVENAQPGIEIGQINQVALLFDVRQMVFKVRIVRPEATALVAEIRIRRALRRHGSRENGDHKKASPGFGYQSWPQS